MSTWKNKVQIDGLQDLYSDFKALSDIDKTEVKRVIKRSVQPMIKTMKSNVRKDTGRLANSIKMIDPDNQKFPFTILVGPDYRPDNRGTMTIAALAAIQEYGAVKRIPRKNAKYKKVLIDGKWKTMSQKTPFKAIPARPFFRPAVDRHEHQIIKEVYFGVEDIIIKTKTKIINK